MSDTGDKTETLAERSTIDIVSMPREEAEALRRLARAAIAAVVVKADIPDSLRKKAESDLERAVDQYLKLTEGKANQ